MTVTSEDRAIARASLPKKDGEVWVLGPSAAEPTHRVERKTATHPDAPSGYVFYRYGTAGASALAGFMTPLEAETFVAKRGLVALSASAPTELGPSAVSRASGDAPAPKLPAAQRDARRAAAGVTAATGGSTPLQ